MTPEHLPICIVGGGLGGLTLARVLTANGIDTVVLEAEPSRHSRVQGGMLDIHAESGQSALRTAGLHDSFRTLVHPGGEAMRIVDRSGTVLRDEADPGTFDRPEIDRGQLRDLLLDALPAATIRWGQKVTGAEPIDSATGRHLVQLADGRSYTTDLLIGADGAWSRIRPLVSDARPAYAGICFLEVDLHDADRRHPAEAAMMGGGMLFALDGDLGVLGHREADGSLHVYVGHRCAEDWIDTIDFADTATARTTVSKMLDGWHPALRGMIEHADGPIIPRRINALPVGHSWPHTPGVTLLGDAAHLMSPFAGEGANLAMLDGAEFGRAIVASPDDLEQAVASYQEALFPRSAAAAQDSADSLELIFAADAPHGLARAFAAAAPA
ncbi:FAD-dependent oxidoreductase [Microlunatus soli]|uniref:Flavin-dependent monooxygenase n=1 Tax=Microlunatus soli TaxID=630515 RepID=A0A1H1WB25_9ACTN|nr:NAD(P)/FAD-dependent oxidoreductase [Microlunatus soli]SDS93881.1 2-polyprenyl-6-methoxyphenol hydroxylase [Microlunatus soli]